MRLLQKIEFLNAEETGFPPRGLPFHGGLLNLFQRNYLTIQDKKL